MYHTGQLREQIEQIVLMGRIYGGSMPSLVAAHGVDANADLPGTLLGSRHILQHFATFEKQNNRVALMTGQPLYEDMMNVSVWNTRGWTFQEKLLSRRCLIFTTEQTYFACKSEI
jgi:hypothetical protein